MLPILIVDDEPHIARLIEMTLEPLGQPLVLACDGEQAADLLEKQQFDLVLLDVMLPGVDGFALMDYIAPTGHAGHLSDGEKRRGGPGARVEAGRV